MRIGTPKEIKPQEYRVGLTPAGVRELTARGHLVFVERGAGLGIGLSDEAYRGAGAELLDDGAQVYAAAELIVKVKEPQASEYGFLRAGHTLFTYLHLAPDPAQARALLDAKCLAIAYETVGDAETGLPLLAPMSEVAGRLAIQAGAHALENAQGGKGVLLGGVPGVAPAEVVIIGGGTVGYHAARIAVGMHARVTVLDCSLSRLNWLDGMFGGRLATLYSTTAALEQCLARADLAVGAVLVPGATAPKLVTREMLRLMQPGSVIVDVAIDQGGCCASSRPTTHQRPTYTVDGIVHYCVANMPSAVSRTATEALTHATLPFVLALAEQGSVRALQNDARLCAGLNVCRGEITHAAVAQALGLPYRPALDALQEA